jgi:exonuclease SbcC
MLRRIVLENYMSHVRTVIEPADSLTILVGPNNCGKSAVVSALQTLCSNLTGDYMVRHGARECSVTVDTTEGHSITWQRRGSTVSYVIDGEEISRLRGGVPERLHDLLRLPAVRSAEDSEDEFDIHFGTQKAPIFLINEPERRAAMFFAASSDAALLMQMQKRHTEKVKDCRRERDRLETESSRLDRELTTLSPLEELARRLQSLEHDYETLGGLDEQLGRLDAALLTIAREQNNWSRRCSELAVLDPLQPPYTPIDTDPLRLLTGTIATSIERLAMETDESRVMAQLREPPILSDAMAIESMCAAIAAETSTWKCVAAIEAAMLPLAPLPDFHETTSLQALVQRYCDARAECARAAAWNSAYAALESPPNMCDVTPQEQVVNNLRRAIQLREAADRSCTALANMHAPPVLADPAPLATTIDVLTTVQREIEQHTRSVDALGQELRDAEQSIRRWARANPNCQTCGAPVDPERLLAHVPQTTQPNAPPRGRL